MAVSDRRFSLFDSIVRPPARQTEQRDQWGRYPESEGGWRDRYEYLRECYHLEPYTERQIDGLHLFRAEDDDGDDLARTRRLVRDFTFVIDKNAEHLFRGGLTLETAEADDDTSDELSRLLAEGQAILRRSKWHRIEAQAGHEISLGRMLIEVQRIPRAPGEKAYKTRLVPHRPETYTVVTDDATGMEIEEVVIRSSYYDADDYDANGDLPVDAMLHHYVRRLTRDHVFVTLDGAPVKDESGPHGLGVVPAVNLVGKPTRETEHGVSAAHGLGLALAMVDSLYTQAHATGARFADPILTGKNVNLSGASVGRFGRSLYWEEKSGTSSEVRYIEPSMGGVKGILDTIKTLHSTARATMPEFGLFDASSAASGEALKTLEAAFVAKVESVRANVLPGIAEAVQMGVHMQRDEVFDTDRAMFRATYGPVLPRDVQSEMAAVLDAKGEGLITTADSIRHLQRLGMVPGHHDPEEYAVMVREESSGRAVEFLKAPDDTGDGPEPDEARAEAVNELTDALEDLGEDEPDLDAIRESMAEALALLGSGDG